MLKSCIMTNQIKFAYFVNIVFEIQDRLGLGYTYTEIADKCKESEFMLYFKDKNKMHNWHLGIWAVGKDWDIKSEYEYLDGDTVVYEGNDNAYGIDYYKPLTISVFILHDWTFDKFRPTYADKEWEIDYNIDNLNDIISELKNILDNPIDSWYNICCDDEKRKIKNKYTTYFLDYYGNQVKPYIRLKKRRYFGYFSSKIINILAKFDKRVYCIRNKFHKDKWNSEYDIALVLKRSNSDYKDWKAYNFYDNLHRKLWKFSNYNVDLTMTYLNDDGTIQENKLWRGVYWSSVPNKED